MTRSYALLLSGGLALSAIAQTPTIIVQGSGAPQVFNSFPAAVEAATASDIIYMSGGDFVLSETIFIDHEVHIVGAGIHPDSAALTLPTRITGFEVRFMSPAANCTVTGVDFVSQMRYGDALLDGQDVQNMLFQRCRFAQPLSGGGASGSTTTFEQCVITRIYAFYSPHMATFRNCLVYEAMAQTFNGFAFEHCTIMGINMQPSSNVFQDCVLVNTNGATSTNSGTYTNCLLYNIALTAPAINNGSVYSLTDPFVDNADLIFQWTDDLNIATGNPGEGIASDGSDPGIFGGSMGWKAGAVPYNPHYTHLDIAPATNANGGLPVNITVTRQTN